jgi:hypothetical protein
MNCRVNCGRYWSFCPRITSVNRQAPNDTTWGPTRLSSFTGARTTASSLWRNPDGSWSGEQQLGGVLTGDPIAAPQEPGDILQLFYRGTNNNLAWLWRNPGPDGSWSSEQLLNDNIITGNRIAAVIEPVSEGGSDPGDGHDGGTPLPPVQD